MSQSVFITWTAVFSSPPTLTQSSKGRHIHKDKVETLPQLKRTHTKLAFIHTCGCFFVCFFLTWMKPYVYSQKMHWRLLSHNNQHWNSGLPAGSVDKLAIPGLFSEPNWAKFLHKCWPKPLSLMCWADEWLHPSYIMGPFSSINSAVKGIGGTGPEGWIPGHM